MADRLRSARLLHPRTDSPRTFSPDALPSGPSPRYGLTFNQRRRGGRNPERRRATCSILLKHQHPRGAENGAGAKGGGRGGIAGSVPVQSLRPRRVDLTSDDSAALRRLVSRRVRRGSRSRLPGRGGTPRPRFSSQLSSGPAAAPRAKFCRNCVAVEMPHVALARARLTRSREEGESAAQGTAPRSGPIRASNLHPDAFT